VVLNFTHIQIQSRSSFIAVIIVLGQLSHKLLPADYFAAMSYNLRIIVQQSRESVLNLGHLIGAFIPNYLAAILHHYQVYTVYLFPLSRDNGAATWK